MGNTLEIVFINLRISWEQEISYEIHMNKLNKEILYSWESY